MKRNTKTEGKTSTESVGVTETHNLKTASLIGLKVIEKEMVKKFNQWDEKIKAKQQPVSIQDLDYWQCVLRIYLREVN